MHERNHLGAVVTGFPLPADAPEPVEEAAERFGALAVALEELDESIAAATAAIEDAKAQDAAAAREAYLAGKPPKDATAGEREACERLAQLQGQRPGLLGAIDVAGDEVALAVNAARVEWHGQAVERLNADAGAFLASIKAAKAALGRLANSRGVVRFLQEWKLVRGAGGAIIGSASEMHYVGPYRCKVDTTLLRRDTYTNPADLLALLATVTAEDPGRPGWRRDPFHVVTLAKESSKR